jgi:hypothetical protein
MADLRQVQIGRFHLAWDGPADVFVAALRDQGILFSRNAHTSTGTAVVPAHFSTTTFFEIAQASGVVLTQILPDEEDLERLFFRLTEGQLPSADAPATEQQAELAHGH